MTQIKQIYADFPAHLEKSMYINQCYLRAKKQIVKFMRTIELKHDIISWVVGLNNENLLRELYLWKKERESTEVFADGIVPPRRKGSLTEGYGIWADNAPFNETNYRDQLWQTEKNAW